MSTSYQGGTVPGANVVRSADYLLLHGNAIEAPNRITAMVAQTRRVAGYRPVPVVFNDDDHFGFDQPANNIVAATRAYASWGFFDFRVQGEGFIDGYENIPINWAFSAPRKKAFLGTLREIFLAD